MTRLLWLAVLVASVAVGCSLGNCTAVCSDPYTLTFVDTAGNPVVGAFGTVTDVNGTPVAFDCGSGVDHMLDAGTTTACTGNTITLQAYADHRAGFGSSGRWPGVLGPGDRDVVAFGQRVRLELRGGHRDRRAAIALASRPEVSARR